MAAARRPPAEVVAECWRHLGAGVGAAELASEEPAWWLGDRRAAATPAREARRERGHKVVAPRGCWTRALAAALALALEEEEELPTARSGVTPPPVPMAVATGRSASPPSAPTAVVVPAERPVRPVATASHARPRALATSPPTPSGRSPATRPPSRLRTRASPGPARPRAVVVRARVPLVLLVQTGRARPTFRRRSASCASTGCCSAPPRSRRP